jgi:hypothetical protein
MRLLVLGFGILIVSFAYEKSPRYGSLLLAIVVLGLLITSQRKGIV